MRLFCLALLALSACHESMDGAQLPSDHQPPPGEMGITLSGPTAVQIGSTYRWAVRDVDLDVGDRVHLGWGSLNAPGFCPHQQLVGGHLCVEIARVGARAQHLAGTNAVVDPLDPTRAVAFFDVLVPNTTLDHVFLQAVLVDGPASATSNVLRVDIPTFPPCPDTFAIIDSPADVEAYAGCTTLSQIRVETPSVPVTELEFPVLHTMNGNIIIGLTGDSGLVRARFPQLQTSTGNIYVGPSDSLQELYAPKLTDLRQLTLSGGADIHTLELPQLTTAEDVSLVAIDHLPVLYLPSLTTVTDTLTYVSSNIPRVGLPALTTVGGNLNITNNVLATQIDLPLLESVGGEFLVANSDALDTLETPVLTSTGSVRLFENPALCVDRAFWESTTSGLVDIFSNLCN